MGNPQPVEAILADLVLIPILLTETYPRSFLNDEVS